MTVHDITLTFPHPSLTPSASRPSYATLTVWQKELSGDAASVISHLGNGRQGHLPLTISEAKYLAITNNVAFVPPLNPPLQPEQATGATGPQITEANRLHLELKHTFKTYQAVDQALRNLLLAAVPHVYVNSLSNDITGFGNVSALTIMTSLWERYGRITQAKLAENLTRMSSPWNPPQPIKDLFLQLNRRSQFASDGSEPISLSQVLRIGYTLIANTGLFAEACREWPKIRDIDKNMDTFQVLFTEAEQDRSSLLTTASLAGYHAGNAAAVIATTPFEPAAAVPPPTEHALAMARVQATADATEAQLATLIAAMKTQTSDRPNNSGNSYCWTHGHTTNSAHTSASCKKQADGHEVTATKTNTMGGSAYVYGR